MFTVLPEPEVYQAYTFLSQKVYKELIVVFADCEIAYRGRAESKA
ncbi:endonuclease NucS, partial [Sulfolobus sp. A20-N-F6]